MNENTLKRIHNHYINEPKDKRGSFVHVIESQLEEIDDINKRNEFLLKVLPYIKEYSTNKQDVVQQKQNEITPNNQLNKLINDHGTIQKGKVYRNFMKDCLSVIIDKNLLSEDNTANFKEQYNCSSSSMKCSECDQFSLVYIVNESSLTCENCGYSIFYQDFSLLHYNNNTINNGEFICQFAYKRMNHFKEWLTQIQGKENTIIPNELIIQIMKELKKERIQNVKNITYQKIKTYLKKNGLSKYYEHIPIIINKICRKDKTTIPNEIEQILIEKFGEIQAPFERHRPPGRKNFLSYSYTLHKLCQLIGQQELVNIFPLLKSRAKLYVQDEIWEKICADLGWKFIPSL